MIHLLVTLSCLFGLALIAGPALVTLLMGACAIAFYPLLIISKIIMWPLGHLAKLLPNIEYTRHDPN